MSGYLRRLGPGDAAAAAVAGDQFGAIAVGQLADLGFTRNAILNRRRRGIIHPKHRGVYLWGHRGGTDQTEVMAAALAVGAGAAASHSTACFLRGYVGRLPSSHHFSLVSAHRRTRRGIIVHEIDELQADDVSVVDRVPVVSAGWALLGLAAISDPYSTRRALSEAQGLGFDDAELRLFLDRSRGCLGWRRLCIAAGLEEGQGFSREEAERRLWHLVVDADLPRPHRNAHVAGYSVDFLWPDHRLIVEVDSYRHHRSRDQFEFDRIKWSNLRSAGYEVMPVTWRQIEKQRGWLLARIAETLARRVAA